MGVYMRKKITIFCMILTFMFILTSCQTNIEKTTIILQDMDGSIVDQYEVSDLNDVFAHASFTPDIDGYSFYEWDQISNEDGIIIYQANYSLNDYMITFETNGGTSLQALTLDFKEQIPLLPKATKDDVYFEGWFVNSSFSEFFDLTTMPARDLTLYAKWNSSPFLYDVDEGEATITGFLYDETATELYIPETIDDYPVTSISDQAFIGYEDIITLEIPNSITYLPQHVLKPLQKLVNLTIPFIGSARNDHATGHGLSYLFYDGEYDSFIDLNLIGEAVPSTLTYLEITDQPIIESFAISGSHVAMLVIGEGTEELKDYAASSENLSYLILPASLLDIHPSAFYGSTGLTSIHVDEDNPNYKSLMVGSLLLTKDEKELVHFANGLKINELIIPESIETIGDFAFSFNQHLIKVHVTDNVTEIGQEAFSYTKQLTTVTFTETSQLETIDDGAFLNASIVYIDVPETVTLIGQYAFSKAYRLEDVTFNGTSELQTIKMGAFSDVSSLRDINIPESVITIEQGAFHSSYDLTIYCDISSKPEGWDEFWYHENDKTTIIWAS